MLNPHIISIQLESKSKTPLYLQLHQQIKELISSQQLTPQEKLPPIRQLSQTLNVNSSTIVQALNLLEKEGLIYKHVGRGTFVTAKTESPFRGPLICDFASITPADELFPINEFKKAINLAFDQKGAHVFNYESGLGLTSLRHKLNSILQQRNIFTDSEHIQIVSGSQQGIDIAAKALIEYGDTIFSEEPTYPGSLSIFKGRGAKIISIPLKKSGLDFVELEKRLNDFRPKLIYVMSNFQNPTGYTYTIDQKKHLLQLAYQHNFYILENDYLSFLNTDATNKSLKALDRWNRVIMLISFSKVLMPGLRIGFFILPPTLKRQFMNVKHATDIATSSLLQHALYYYLESFSWEEHLQLIRTTYYQRYGEVKEFLQAHASQLSFFDSQGGPFFWVQLKQEGDADTLAYLARQKGVSIAAGSNFFPHQQRTNSFRLSFANCNQNQLQEGLKLLGLALKEYQNNTINQNKDFEPIV